MTTTQETRGGSDLQGACDAVLAHTVDSGGVPGVVAVVTDRERTLYEGVCGVRELGGSQEMTADTVFSIFSTTKAVTATCCLQLVEEGRLDLDAPASTYVDGLAGVQVLDGFGDDGTPRLRAPASEPTTRQLLLHTAGFGYEFFDADYLRLAREQGQASVVTGARAALDGPLLFDPGTRWLYGSSIDWAGQVVEAITGQRLGEVMTERVLGPLGMTSTAFDLSPGMRERKASMHQRDAGGALSVSSFELPADPEVQMGGHGLWSTAPDYARFLRMWLREGRSDDGQRVLAAETVEMAAVDHLGGLAVTGLPGVVPSLSNDVEFFPGQAKSWGLSFMINDEDAPTGRPAGSLAWAGLANLYYWIDRRNGLAGFWATQLFPFADPASMGGYLELETAVYDTLGAVGAEDSPCRRG